MSVPVPSGARSSRRVVADPRRRDLVIAVGAGLLVLAFVAWAVVSLSRTAASSGGVEGVIVRKQFAARPEQQITVGRGGLSSREVAGEYVLVVRVAPADGGGEYRVSVSAPVYESHHEGERYYFIRPKPGG